MIMGCYLTMLVEILKPIKTRKGILKPGSKIDLPEPVATQLIFDEKIKPVKQRCSFVHGEQNLASPAGSDTSNLAPTLPPFSMATGLLPSSRNVQ